MLKLRVSLLATMTLLICLTSSQTLTIPINRKQGIEPITRSQILLTEHRKSFLGDSENDSIDLINYQNLAYTGPIYFTNEFQGKGETSDFVYDTGSGVLTTTSVSCINGCKTSYYDQSKSQTAVSISKHDEVLNYGSAILQGRYVQDTVCIATNSSECV